MTKKVDRAMCERIFVSKTSRSRYFSSQTSSFTFFGFSNFDHFHSSS